MFNVILVEVDQVSSVFLVVQGKIGQNICDNEWFMSICGCIIILGGVCEFDLLVYYVW